jgi:hypothetical protein
VVLPGAREVQLSTTDGLRLGAWYLPGPEPDPVAVLVANGNGGHRGLRAPPAAVLHEAGPGVLLFDYRGYAGNPGRPSGQGLAPTSGRRSLLVGDAAVHPGRLLHLGESLGAAVVELAPPTAAD